MLDDLVGKKFNRLTVLSLYEITDQRRAMWLCKCDCGEATIVRGDGLKSGSTKSCGCYNRGRIMTHGMKGTQEYKAWQSMRQRCENPKDSNYKDYGARGIKVCRQWKDFSVFIRDMGLKPSPSYTLDRVDNDSGYFKTNCRWATCQEQSNNRRRTVFMQCHGETLPLAEWSRKTGVPYGVLWQRYTKLNWSPINTLYVPVR